MTAARTIIFLEQKVAKKRKPRSFTMALPTGADPMDVSPPLAIDDADDDDDDMADLFSFGASEPPPTPTVTPPPEMETKDSFLEMIDNADMDADLLHAAASLEHDKETQDILDWLDEDDHVVVEDDYLDVAATTAEDDLPEAQESPRLLTPPPVSYNTLVEALEDENSTKQQISELYPPPQGMDASLRPLFYCRWVCGKTLTQVQSSSFVDSFMEYTPSENRISMDSEMAAKIANQARRPVTQIQHDWDRLVAFFHRNDPTNIDLSVAKVLGILLATGLDAVACSVLWQQWVPSCMPLLALQKKESQDAARVMHEELYLLCCYHLPLLVTHLDRHMHGWHLPERMPDWLVTWAASSTIPIDRILTLWDDALVNPQQESWFFRLLSLLEQASSDLILLTGEELRKALDKALVAVPDDASWYNVEAMQNFIASTPMTVLSHLSVDGAMHIALERRQKLAELQAKRNLAVQARDHAIQQHEQSNQARLRLTRARLLVYYRKHAPEKEDNIDKIMETYDGRWDVLDAKLIRKYGESFNPVRVKPYLPPIPPEPPAICEDYGDKTTGSNLDKVSVFVHPKEVLPVVCWSSKSPVGSATRRPLKFYLVDARSDEARTSQGQFPTAVSLGPSVLMDPEELEKQEELFESLRGAAHVCVMGEGFSAVPDLYDQEMSDQLSNLAEQDEACTNNCALWFVKRGFPFVSVLEGGFCAAHSWLVREGKDHDLTTSSVLVDYHPESSLFGQLENLHNATASEKAQRKMTALLDKSLTAMTIQVESIAADLDEGRAPAGLRKLFQRGNNNDFKAQPATTAESASNGNTARQNGTTELESKTDPKSFKMPNFGAIGKKALERVQSDEGQPVDGTQPASEAPKFRNPFARGEAQATNGGAATEKFRNPFARKDGIPKESPAGNGESGDQSSDAASKPFGMFRKGKEETNGESKGTGNMFQGLGAAIQGRKGVTPAESTEDSKRNAFRFGNNRSFGGFKNLMNTRKEQQEGDPGSAPKDEAITFV